ncbi:MAG: Sensor histidine kinase RcsC [Candidatus Celerinatantimonas neptuna]|nr:MAG: Sensor histidine kinase RcsC [Candidatus Celerinatantimonas neptuna]
MLHLKTLSTRKLFILYIILSALLLGVIGGVVVHQQSTQVVAKIQQETIQVELQTAKRYLLQYLNDREIAFRRIAALPILLRTVTQPTTSIDHRKLKKYLNQAQVFSKKSQIALYNVHSQSVFNAIQSSFNQQQTLKVVGRILTGSPSEVLIQLIQYQQHEYFMLYLPIVSQQHIAGVMVAKLNFDLAYFFSTIVNNHNRWIGLSQPSSGVEMYPLNHQKWRLYEVPLGYSDLVMNYAVSTQAETSQRENLLYRLGGMLALSLLLSLVAIYLLGQQMLVKPFQELAKSREQLSRHSRLLAEREIEAKRLAQVAQHAHDSIIITNSAGYTTWVNDAFITLTGYSSREVLGINPGELLQGPDTDYRTKQQISEALMQQKGVRSEILNYKKNGQSYWIDIDITPVFNTNGQLESYIAVQRDITGQRELEASLRRALHRAKEANEAKLRFLASMSHEIRTPMNGVLGLAQLLEQTPLNTQQQNYLQDLYHSGQHMMALLNDILDFSKIDARRLELEMTSFSFQNIIEGIHRTYSALCKQQGIKFLVDNRIKSPNIITDRERLRQIILNLVSNAVKFTSQGQIRLSVRESTCQQHPYLVIRVEDSGIGIAPERCLQIFEPFTQAESSTTRKYGGSGLGLSIVKRLCQAMGGDVRVRSKLGKGSIFTATVQIQTSETDRQIVTEITQPFDGQGLQVLIAEDNQTNGMILKAFLEKRQFNCDIALNGQQAMDAQAKHPYPVILMDNHMPELDGINATSQIRRMSAPQCFSLIIGCTADAYSETRRDMLQAGINDVLTKPLRSESLDSMLHRYQKYFTHWTQWGHAIENESKPESDANEKLILDETIPLNIHEPTTNSDYCWEQMNAAIAASDYDLITQQASGLLNRANQTENTHLAAYAEELIRLSHHAKLPELEWLKKFQQLQQQFHQHTFIS